MFLRLPIQTPGLFSIKIPLGLYEDRTSLLILSLLLFLVFMKVLLNSKISEYKSIYNMHLQPAIHFNLYSRESLF